jgi:hypothetical protein
MDHSLTIGPFRRARTGSRLAHIAVVGLLWIGMAMPAAASTPEVRFDVVRLVACQDVTTEAFAAANPDERLLQARLEVSSLITQGDESNLLQYFYQVTSPQRRLQIADYQPRTTAASDYAGDISIEKRKEKNRSLGLSVSSAWDYMVGASGHGEMGTKDSSSVRYELVPPQESVAASGTMYRGYGVYFKLKRMRQSLLEGAKEFVITFRAQRDWRSDYLYLRCQATGIDRSIVRRLDEEVRCGAADFLVALHLEGDEASKAAARDFIEAAIQLRRTAARNRQEIHKQNFPTVFHEFGALVGAVEPKLSDTWLSELIYLQQQTRLQRITSRLPADVRDAAHNYLAARDALDRLHKDTTAQPGVQR